MKYLKIYGKVEKNMTGIYNICQTFGGEGTENVAWGGSKVRYWRWRKLCKHKMVFQKSPISQSVAYSTRLVGRWTKEPSGGPLRYPTLLLYLFTSDGLRLCLRHKSMIHFIQVNLLFMLVIYYVNIKLKLKTVNRWYIRICVLSFSHLPVKQSEINLITLHFTKVEVCSALIIR